MRELTAVVEEHSAAVWRTAFRLLNNHQDALDCYQDTFAAALRLSEPVEQWRPLLLRIATCKAVDQLRRRYQSQKLTVQLHQLSPAQSHTPDAGAELRYAELQEQVRRALVELPPQQAEAFWLRHLEQLSPEEVARAMNLPAGNVRVLVHRAAARLRNLLGESQGQSCIAEEAP